MASTRPTYPTIPANAWRILRERFDQTVPAKVTPSYLATVLNSRENSVRANVIPGLKAVGLIGDDGVPTPRVSQWRDKEGYADACKDILREVYPGELLEAVPDPSSDRDAAKRWFKNKTGCGENAASKMTSLYCLLVEADATAHDGARPKTKKKRAARSKGKQTNVSVSEEADPTKRDRAATVTVPDLPEMRLSLEIRIDAGVTPKQIDQIFASMAKHLYPSNDQGR